MNTLGAIDELKDYYKCNEDAIGDIKTSRKLLEILQVKGAAAWFIHNAVKRNYDKHQKGNSFIFLTISWRLMIVRSCPIEFAATGYCRLDQGRRVHCGRRQHHTQSYVGPCKELVSRPPVP